jgi:hypothetical protein
MLVPVQTFWIDPHDHDGGWLKRKFSYYSWALSCIMLKKNFGKVILHTDTKGADLLIGDLDLPYSEVRLSLDSFESPWHSAWAQKKLYTYSLQKDPFVHIDGDAYLFSSFEGTLNLAELVAQNLEYNHPYYQTACSIIHSEFDYFPAFSNNSNELWAVNAGIIGGNNISFFKTLYTEVVTFLERNYNCLHKIAEVPLNTYIEQFLFKQLANALCIDISFIIPDIIGYPCNYGLDKFYNLPGDSEYIHIMNYKKNPTICYNLAQRLWIESSSLFTRCERYAENKSKNHFNNFSKWKVNSFERTSHIVSSLTSLDHDNSSDKDVIAPFNVDVIDNYKYCDHYNQILDIYLFEEKKHKFCYSFPKKDFEFHWKEFSRDVNRIFSEQEYETAVITESIYIYRISSQWNWSENNEFSSQSRFDITTNFNQPSSYFEVIFFYCIQLDLFRELLLDPIDIFIFDQIKHPISICSVIDSTVVNVYQLNKDLPKLELRNVIMDKVRFFIYLGLIHVHKP